jgi:hypothetical protein
MKKGQKLLIYAIILLLTPFFSCVYDPPNQKKLPPKQNFIVLLDLSDRILSANQISRDIVLIEYAYEAFLQTLKDQFYFSARDEFKIVMAYQQNAVPSSKMFELEDDLYVNVNKLQAGDKKLLKTSWPQYRQKVEELYRLARFSENHNDYKGADIQGYLRDRLAADLPKDQETINNLIILTDGYQYVEGKSRPIDNWPSIADLSDVNVIVMEMSPNMDRAGEQSAMISAWTDWLDQMNAKRKELVMQSALEKEKQVLFDFLNIGVSRPQVMAQKEEIELPAKRISEGSSKVPDGDYISLQGGKVRSLRIRKVKDEGDVEVFQCSLLQLGSDYHNLHGEIDAATGLLTITKLGTFGIQENEQNYRLISNTKNLEYSLRK